MYTLDCPYYDKDFDSIHDLVQDVLRSGTDPNYEILEDGVGIGETAFDFLVP